MLLQIQQRKMLCEKRVYQETKTSKSDSLSYWINSAQKGRNT